MRRFPTPRWLSFIGCLLAFPLALTAQVRPASAELSGIVVNAQTHEPLERANVVLSQTTLGRSSGQDGTFRISNIPPGHYDIVASYIGFEPWRSQITLSAGEERSVRIELVPTILPGQTIVITATRARERETPATFANISARDLAERYSTQDIPQLLSELPSVTWYSENGNGIGYNYLTLRGFDQRRISVMINGIPQNDPEDHNIYWIDFPDLAANLDDIQVQRGAGSAFYGPPAIGGSVNMVTGYSHRSGIDLFAGGGSFNTQKYSVAVNSGLVGDRYIFTGRLSHLSSDGYRQRSWTKLSSYYLSAVRYDEAMTTQLNFYGGPIEDHLAYYGIAKEEATSSDPEIRRKNPIERPEEIENFSQPHYELLHEWRLTETLTLNNALFYITGEGFFDYDGSWAPYTYYRITPSNGFPVGGDPDTLYISNALIRAYVENRQVGWLPRISLRHPRGELTVGAEIRFHTSLHWGALRWGEALPQGVTPEYHYYEYRGGKRILSLYAREAYSLLPNITLLAHLQYVYNQYRLFDEKYIGTDFRVPYHFLNPRLGININVTERWNLVAHVSRTSREPRLKNLYDAAEASTPSSWGPVTPQFEVRPDGSYDFSQPLVKPESLLGLELGIGYVSSVFRASVNLYDMRFKNEIVKQGQLDRFGQPVTGNADRTVHQGLEVVAAVDPVDGATIEGNMTVSRNRLLRYDQYEGSTPVSLDGNTIAGFPEFLANVRATYRWEQLTVSLSLQHVGEFYTDNFQNPGAGRTDPTRTVDAYSVVHAWLTYELPTEPFGQSVEARLQITNLFNRIYASHGEGDQFFPAAERNIFASLRVRL